MLPAEGPHAIGDLSPPNPPINARFARSSIRLHTRLSLGKKMTNTMHRFRSSGDRPQRKKSRRSRRQPGSLRGRRSEGQCARGSNSNLRVQVHPVHNIMINHFNVAFLEIAPSQSYRSHKAA